MHIFAPQAHGTAPWAPNRTLTSHYHLSARNCAMRASEVNEAASKAYKYKSTEDSKAVEKQDSKVSSLKVRRRNQNQISIRNFQAQLPCYKAHLPKELNGHDWHEIQQEVGSKRRSNARQDDHDGDGIPHLLSLNEGHHRVETLQYILGHTYQLNWHLT